MRNAFADIITACEVVFELHQDVPGANSVNSKTAARITILQGPLEMMLRHPAMAHPMETDSVYTLRTRPGFAVPWEGARRLLAQLRVEMGDAPVANALAPCRGMLSLVLRELEESLTPQQRRERDRHSALYLAKLPLIEPSPRALAEEWAEALAPLFNGRRAVVVIPDCASLDRETLLLVRPLLRRLVDCSGLRFVFGFDPRLQPEAVKRLTIEPIVRELRLLAALDGTEEHVILDNAQRAGERTGSVEPCRIDSLDDDLEWDAWQALRAAVREPAAPLGDLALRGVRRACECFGFAEALELAESLRVHDLDSAQAAELHYLAGLAAAYAGSSPQLAALSKTYLSAALADTGAPAERAIVMHHLCRVAPSKELADGMVEAARTGPSAGQLRARSAGRSRPPMPVGFGFARERQVRLRFIRCRARFAFVESVDRPHSFYF